MVKIHSPKKIIIPSIEEAVEMAGRLIKEMGGIDFFNTFKSSRASVLKAHCNWWEKTIT